MPSLTRLGVIYTARQGESPACGEEYRFHALVEQAVRFDVVTNVEGDSLAHPGVY